MTIREALPYAKEERRVLRVIRVPLLGFDEATRAGESMAGLYPPTEVDKAEFARWRQSTQRPSPA